MDRNRVGGKILFRATEDRRLGEGDQSCDVAYVGNLGGEEELITVKSYELREIFICYKEGHYWNQAFYRFACGEQKHWVLALAARRMTLGLDICSQAVRL